MESKPLFKSKIFWLNIVAALLGVFAVFTPELLSGLGLGEHAVEKVLTIIGAITTFLNIAFRILSNTTIKMVVFLVVASSLQSCNVSYHVQKVIKYTQKHSTATVKRERNGAITTTVKYQDFYNPSEIKKTFDKAKVTFDAVVPYVLIETTTKDTTIPLILPSFKK